MRKFILLLSFVALITAAVAVWYFSVPAQLSTLSTIILPTQIPSATPTPALQPPPGNKILANNYHVFQNFNNCGPAALSMGLSYYGIQVDQDTLGRALRPYQNLQGDNDDKSVTLTELAEESKKYGFIPFHRPNGNIEKVKLLITYDLPVIARTWLKEDEDIGHYRVIKGYNETSLLQDDSLQGKNLWYTYEEFNTLWGKFNYEYVVLVPQEKVTIVESILQEDADEQAAWEKAVANATQQLDTNPDDVYTRFNLAVALYKTGQYQTSVEEYEKIEARLPSRTLWYQLEPILAYYQLKNYEKVFAITEHILNNQNRAYSELYIIRGDIYKERGEIDLAKQEYEKAVFYNQNLKSAQEAINSI